ncbi:MAG TPA: hypothetical protein VNN73_14795 [Blastocatellia bacterium]|nr:hypothetical protein [Blastocatellia bacterium]
MSSQARFSGARVTGRRSTYREYFSKNGGTIAAIFGAVSLPVLLFVAWWFMRAIRSGIGDHFFGALFFGIIGLGAIIYAYLFFEAMFGRANITSDCPVCGARDARLFSAKNASPTACGHCSAYQDWRGYITGQQDGSVPRAAQRVVQG